jgi:hypothetical protein
MATDTTDPKVGLIFRIAVLAIGTLVVIHAVATTYFDRMARAEVYRKVGSTPPEALWSLRADEKQRLTSGSMPIDKSMQMLAAKGRMGAPEIAPSVSKDVAPLQGWARMPAEVPPTMMPPAPSSAPSAATSAAPPAAASASSSAAPAGSGSKAPRHP